MTQYREKHPPTDAWKNTNTTEIPRWIFPIVTSVHQDPLSLVLTIISLTAISITVNATEWFVHDGETNTVFKMTDAAFLAAYEPIV